MLVPHTGTARCFGGPAQSVGRAARGDLPQGRQVFLGKEVVLGPAGLSRPVDFPRPQPLQQVGRFDIHQFYLVGGIEHLVRHPLSDGYAGDGGYNVVQTFQMLDIDSGIYVDPRPEQLFDILIPFEMATARRVGMSQFIHQ